MTANISAIRYTKYPIKLSDGIFLYHLSSVFYWVIISTDQDPILSILTVKKLNNVYLMYYISWLYQWWKGLKGIGVIV